MKKIKYNLTFWLIIASVVSIILGLVSGTIYDKSDWIFLFLLVGIIVLNIKLNTILKLVSRKKS